MEVKDKLKIPEAFYQPFRYDWDRRAIVDKFNYPVIAPMVNFPNDITGQRRMKEIGELLCGLLNGDVYLRRSDKHAEAMDIFETEYISKPADKENSVMEDEPKKRGNPKWFKGMLSPRKVVA